MAFSVRAVSENTPANTSSTDVPKPSGLTVGDLMILHVGIGDDRTITQPSGFTEIDNTLFGAQRGALYWKIADSSDVAASNFTVNFSDSTENMAAMIALTGHDSSTPIDTFAVGTGTSTSMTTAGLTTASANSLLILFVHVEDNNTHSGYAITNDDPTWTEAYDSNTPIGNDYALAAAYGVKSSAGATGTSTVTSSFSDDYVAHILAIAPEAASGVTGDIAQEMTSISQSASGSVAIAGDAAQTMTSVSQSGSGSVLVQGAASQEMTSISQSASGTVSDVTITGTADQTMTSLSQTASGSVLVSGSASQELTSVSQSSSGSVLVSGSVSQEMTSISQSAEGVAASSRTGTIAQELSSISQSASGSVSGGRLSGFPAYRGDDEKERRERMERRLQMEQQEEVAARKQRRRKRFKAIVAALEHIE